MADSVVTMTKVSKFFETEVALEDISLTVEDGEFLTLLGPSGCGKTTALRLIGGFETCDTGEIRIDGKTMRDIPPEARPVNTVFQSYALFPHMTIADNVAFGLRMLKVPATEVAQRVREALELVQLTGMESKKPSELSGGQQQRVAIARALVNNPRVLLLDEPMSALDYRLRKRMQKELKAIQRKLGITFILVTHDQEEAFTMSDRVVVMDHGRIAQVGTPREIYEEPASMYVARFVGEINELHGVVVEQIENGWRAQVEGQDVSLRTERVFAAGDQVSVLLRPEDFRVELLEDVRDSDEVADKFQRAMLKGRVERQFYKGATYDLDVLLDNGKSIVVTEFFDEDSETVAFESGDRVAVGWFEGWEVVLPHEQQ